MSFNQTAHVIVSIDTRTLRVTAAGIYSERHPTVMQSNYSQAEVFSSSGRDFQDAIDNVKRAVRHNDAHAWLVPLLQASGSW